MKRLILRVALASVLFITTLEMCARIDDAASYGAPLVGSYDNETLYTFDRLGKTGKPYGRYLKWKLNAQGFRGPDLQPGRVRIMCVGSSETFGLYERENGEWPRQLETLLNQRAGGSMFDVVNTSYPGMTLATSLPRLPEWLNAVKPGLVVVYPSLANYIWLPTVGSSPKRPPKRPFFEPRIARRVETLLKSILPESLQDRIRVFQTERAARRYKEIMPRLPERNVARFSADLERLIDETDRAGADLVLVTHATLFGATVRDEHRPVLRQWRKFYPMLAEEGFLDMEQRLNDVIRETARRRGKLLVDAARQLPSGHEAFAEFVHFTDEGALSLATLVARQITPLLEGKTAHEPRKEAATRP